MMGWHWHQLDHMQIICTLLQTDNHSEQRPAGWSVCQITTQILQAGCPSCRPTNSVKALKANLFGITKGKTLRANQLLIQRFT